MNNLFSSTHILLQNIQKNIRYWNTSIPIFDKYVEEGKTSYEILKSLSFENDVEDKVIEEDALLVEEEEEEEEEEQSVEG